MITEEVRQTDKDGFLILPKKFKSHGFNFEQVVREGDFAIYKKWKDGQISISWEVIKIMKQKEFKLGDTIIPKKEAFCSDSQWGIFGFTLCSKEDALKKMDLIMKNE